MILLLLMCSVTEDNALLVPTVVTSISPICRKCETEQSKVVLRKTDPYCESCFLTFVTHKFRATLGKSKLLKKGKKVMIAYSGGANSTAMLDLIDRGSKLNSHKCIQFTCVLLYLDDGAFLDLDEDTRTRNCREVKTRTELYPFPVYVVRFEDWLYGEKKCLTDEEFGVFNSKYTKRLQDLVSGMKSMTAKQDLIEKLRLDVLVEVCKSLEHNVVFLGQTSTSLAVDLLTGIAEGHGLHGENMVGICDNVASVQVMRPLRELSAKEMAYYNRFQSLEVLFTENISTKSGGDSSIRNVTQEFLMSLHDQFEGTMNTIVRTGNKLRAAGEQSSEVCILCQHTLDTNTSECSALNARTFSENLFKDKDKSRDCGDQGSSGECCKSEGSCCEKKRELCGEDLGRSLCYGCDITVKEMKDTGLLPESVVGRGLQAKTNQKLHDQIKDFLL